MQRTERKLLEYYVHKAKLVFKRGGLRALWRKASSGLSRTRHYRNFFANTEISPDQLADQRQQLLTSQPKISIVIPLYNTPIRFFTEMVESVLRQSYGNWELCLADGSDRTDSSIQTLIQTDYRNEHRISYIRLEGNAGISGNTNAALTLATGAYVALMDHDDLLAPNALHEVVCAINEQSADFLYTDEMSFVEKPNQVTSIHFKPDFAIDNLRSNNYICHLTIFKRQLLDKTGPFNRLYDGSQDYDFILRLSEVAEKIVHIPKVLYYWRVHPDSVASDISAKPYCILAAKNAIAAHLARVGCAAVVEGSTIVSTYRIRYAIESRPTVSIIVPLKPGNTRVGIQLKSLLSQTRYDHLEIVLVGDDRQLLLIGAADDAGNLPDIQNINWQGGWNPVEMHLLGAKHAKGQYLVFLTSVIQLISPDWIDEMLMLAQRNDVGAVGAKLYYPNKRIAHAGIAIGLPTLFSYLHRGCLRDDPGYMSRLTYTQDVSAVSGACLMIEARKYTESSGFDSSFSSDYAAVDLCIRLRQQGMVNIFTPYAELICSQDSRSISSNVQDINGSKSEGERFRTKWEEILSRGDPYYSTNLSLTYGEFSTIL